MADVQQIPSRQITAKLVNVQAYVGVTYGISVTTKDGVVSNILVTGPTSEAVAAAIHAAWPGQPVQMDKMARVMMIAAKDIEDDEL